MKRHDEVDGWVMHRDDGGGATLDAAAAELVAGAAAGVRRPMAGAALGATLVDSLRTARLTVLTGAAGSGKSALLHEAVRPLLRRRLDDRAARPAPAVENAAGEGVDLLERRRRRERPRELVVWCDCRDDSPTERLHTAFDEAAGTEDADADAGDGADAGLRRAPIALRAQALAAARGARVLFVLDHADWFAPGPAAECDALIDALCNAGPPVHLLVSARDDALPPSLGFRIERQGARVLRLPDRRSAGAAPPRRASVAVDPPDRSDSTPWTPPPVSAERPLQRDDVYASIVGRLAEIGDGAHEPPWGGAGASVETAVPAPRPPGVAAVDPVAARGRGARPPARGKLPWATSAPWAAWALRGRKLQSADVRLVGIGLAAAAAVGVSLWRDRLHPVLRQVPLAAVSAPAVPRAAALPDSLALDPLTTPDVAMAAEAPALAPPGASSPPPQAATPADVAVPPAPGLLATAEPVADARVTDELWRGMAAHGAAGLRLATFDDPVQELSTGQRLAVVPYDVLRTLAATPATARSARVVAPLFTEELQVIVRADSPLRFIHDIGGRPINVGPARSRRHQTAEAFYREAFGTPLPPSPGSTDDLPVALRALLRGGGTEVIVLPEAQPSAWLAQLTETERRGLRLLRLAPDAPSTRRALRSYLPATLHVDNGAGTAEVPALAVMTFLVSNRPAPASGSAVASGSGSAARALAQAVCQALPDLRRQGRAPWRDVDPALRLPVPLAYDAEAAAAFDACAAGRDAAAAHQPTQVSQADNPLSGAHE